MILAIARVREGYALSDAPSSIPVTDAAPRWRDALAAYLPELVGMCLYLETCVRVLAQIEPHQGFPSRLIGVDQTALPIEHDHPLAEPVQQGLGERGEHGGERVEGQSVRHG